MYRATRNLSIARHLVRQGSGVDPASLSEAGLARLIAKGYVVFEDDAPQESDPEVIEAAPMDKGEAAPVMQVRGIGPERAKALAALGILTTVDLTQADAIIVAQRLGVSSGHVARWQAEAHAITMGKETGCGYCGK